MFHGLIIRESLADHKIIQDMVIGKKLGEKWIIYKIEFPNSRLNEVVNLLRKNIKKGYYAHLYDENGKLVVIFREKVFKLSANDKNTWIGAINYGLSLGIPREQLDFYPCKFEDETY